MRWMANSSVLTERPVAATPSSAASLVERVDGGDVDGPPARRIVAATASSNE